MKETFKVSRLQSTKIKIENHLGWKKVENKAHQQQIKKLQADLLVIDSQADKGVATQKLLNEKENTIQMLKKKVKISSTELTELEKEKETLNGELNDCKEKLLKFVEEKK